MSTSSPSESASDRTPEKEVEIVTKTPEPADRTSAEAALEQLLNLKHEVEQNHRTIARLQGSFYTLVTGLVLAAAIAISVAGFFAYLLLNRERLARQEVGKNGCSQCGVVRTLCRNGRNVTASRTTIGATPAKVSRRIDGFNRSGSGKRTTVAARTRSRAKTRTQGTNAKPTKLAFSVAIF